MSEHLDDILILIGVLLLGAFLYVSVGVAATMGYVGAILIVLGVVLGLRQPRGGKP